MHAASCVNEALNDKPDSARWPYALRPVNANRISDNGADGTRDNVVHTLKSQDWGRGG